MFGCRPDSRGHCGIVAVRITRVPAGPLYDFPASVVAIHIPANTATSPTTRLRVAEASAAMTPTTAMPTPIDFRKVNGSMPSKAPISIVWSGRVESARLARAAVVKLTAILYKTKNSPKKQTPRAAIAGQSPRGGHRTRRKSAVGKTHRKPIPHRTTASVIGSASRTKYRVTAAAVPPRQLETNAIATPNHSPARTPPSKLAIAFQRIG